MHPGYWWGYWTSNWSVPGSGGYLKFDSAPQHFVDSIEYVRFVEPLMQGRAASVWEVYNRQLEHYRNQWLIAEAISFISPAQQLRKTLTSLADTGYEVYGNFMDSVRLFRRRMISGFERRGYFSDNALGFFCRRPASDIDDEKYEQRRAYYRQQSQAGKHSEEYIGPHLWGPLPDDEIPRYEYVSDSPEFGEAVQPGLTLVVSIAIVFSIGFAAFLRYDVR